MGEGWTWRIEDPDASSQLRLKYEPGGWGDIIKGIWAAELAATLRATDPGPIRFGDPFAGAPDYPLLDRVAERVEAARGTRFHEVQATAGKQGRFLSTAGVVRTVAAEPFDALVFDVDQDRRTAWCDVPGATVAKADSGWDLLSADAMGPRDLVLVDPYDLANPRRWSQATAGLSTLLAEGAHLLLYIYNRGRRVSDLAGYQSFRQTLEQDLGGPPRLVGRVPSDALLPRAWHELLLLESPRSLRPLPACVLNELDAATRRLATTILAPALVERNDP